MNNLKCYYRNSACKNRVIYKVIHKGCSEEFPCSPDYCIAYTCKTHYRPSVDRILIDYSKDPGYYVLKRNKEAIRQELRRW